VATFPVSPLPGFYVEFDVFPTASALGYAVAPLRGSRRDALSPLLQNYETGDGQGSRVLWLNVHDMRSKLLLGFLLITTSAFWRANPIYSLTGRNWPPCVQALDKASECNNLRGPVHTAEIWLSLPDDRDSAWQGVPATHRLLTYSKDGFLMEWGIGKMAFSS
jgi:hypothetical protein